MQHVSDILYWERLRVLVDLHHKQHHHVDGQMVQSLIIFMPKKLCIMTVHLLHYGDQPSNTLHVQWLKVKMSVSSYKDQFEGSGEGELLQASPFSDTSSADVHQPARLSGKHKFPHTFWKKKKIKCPFHDPQPHPPLRHFYISKSR